MSMNGGYVMIDGMGIDLTSEVSQTKTGLFANLKKVIATGKPVFAYNLNWGTGSNKALSPLPVFVQQWSDDLIVATCSILKVNITSEDAVTVESLVS